MFVDNWSPYTTGLDGATLGSGPAPMNSGQDLTMDPAQLAAYQNKFGSPFTADPGHLVNYGEGVTGYEGGTTLRNSQYGPHLTTQRDGNFIWQNNDWTPTPEASGSLFGDFIKPIGLFASLVAGGGALSNLVNGAAGGAGGLSGAGGMEAGLPDFSLSNAGGMEAGLPDFALPEYTNTLGDWPVGTPDIGAVTPGPMPANQQIADLWQNAGTQGYDQYGNLLSPEQQISDLWENAGMPGYDQYGAPTDLPVGNVPWYEQIYNTIKGGVPGLPTGALNTITKLLTGVVGAKSNRDSLEENARRLGESKDTTPLRSSTWKMLEPQNVMRRAQGGLASYVQGGTSGQADKIPALLSDGEYVFDADTVAALGDGNNAAGAAALDQMRQSIRKHKRSAPIHKIPPKAKRPEQYMKGAQK